MRYQDASLEQEVEMKMDNAGMDTPEYVYISRLEGVKRESTAIIIMKERKSTAEDHQIHTQTEVKTLTSPVI